jgi:hypothetical protein
MPYRVPEGVLATELSGETVLLDSASGVYFNLNESGTLIWRTLAERGSADAAVEALTSAFGVGAEQAAADVRELIEQLQVRGLVEGP